MAKLNKAEMNMVKLTLTVTETNIYAWSSGGLVCHKKLNAGGITW